jgi:hypothetical protein
MSELNGTINLEDEGRAGLLWIAAQRCKFKKKDKSDLAV